MTDVQLPRLLNSSLNGVERTIRPISMSVNLSIVPLSYASMELPRGEGLPARGYVEIYTSMGFAGVFRVRSPQDAYGEDITTAELEHAIVEVGDYLVLNKYKEMMAASTAMQTVFSHYRGNKWQLGDVSALGSGEIALQADHDRVLEAMIAILDQKPDCMMAFDFSTLPWTVSVVKRGTVVQAEGRLSRNVNSAKVIYDDTELVTRCYYEYRVNGATASDVTTAWAYVDTDTMSQYGLVERTAPVGSGYTQSEAMASAVAYAEKHKKPRVSVSISAEEFSAITGEDFDTFSIGKLFRLALVDYNVTVEQVVTALSWNNVFDAPEDITVSLDDEEDTAITFLHDLDAKGRAGGGGGGGKKQDDLWKEYWTRIDKDDKHIELIAAHVDVNDEILEQAGLYLDSHGVLVYADDNENMVASKLKVQADKVGMVVGTNASGNYIKVAEISAAINEDGTGTARINADHIYIGPISGTDTDYTSKTLDGTITAISSDFTTVNTLVARKIEASYITADRIRSLVDGGTFSSLATTSLTVGGVSYAPSAVLKSIRGVNNGDGTYTLYQKVMGGSESAVLTFERGDTDAAYNQGWNDCIDAATMTGAYYLSGYTNYNNGNSANLWRSDSSVQGGFVVATGAARVWRYGGSSVYRYTLPDKK